MFQSVYGSLWNNVTMMFPLFRRRGEADLKKWMSSSVGFVRFYHSAYSVSFLSFHDLSRVGVEIGWAGLGWAKQG